MFSVVCNCKTTETFQMTKTAIDKLYYSATMEYLESENKVQLHVSTWMNLTNSEKMQFAKTSYISPFT